jgi:hypothetical protein
MRRHGQTVGRRAQERDDLVVDENLILWDKAGMVKAKHPRGPRVHIPVKSLGLLSSLPFTS